MRSYCVYTDESGLTPDEGFILYGMLFIPIEVHAQVHSELQQIFGKAKGGARKSRNNFLMKLVKNKDIETLQKLLKEDKNAFEMKFSNINKINLSDYKKFIDIIKCEDIRFFTYVVDKKGKNNKLTHHEFFVNKYADALTEGLKMFNEGDGFFIMCDEISTPKSAEKLFEDQLKSKTEYKVRKKNLNRNIYGIVTICSHASLFCQVCDLLLGTVTSRMKEKQKLKIKKEKKLFTQYVNNLIGSKNDFCGNISIDKPIGFRVKHVKK